MKEDNAKLFSDVIHYFKTSFDIKDSGKDAIKLGVKSFTARQFNDKFKKEIEVIAKACDRSLFYRIVDEVKRSKGYSEDNQAYEFMSDKVFNTLKKEVSKEHKEKITVADSIEMITSNFDWSNHLPIIDIKTKESLMYNHREHCVDYNVSYDAWNRYANTRNSDTRKLLMESVTPAVVRYDPNSTEEVYYKDVSGQKDILHLNAHRTPKWRTEGIGKKLPVPKEFTELMEALFPSKKCQDYVIFWLYKMMTGRNHCYLLLHGDQGIGKNTLVNIAAKLVGETNYALISPDFWEGRFNGELRNKRLVFFDESIIDEKYITKVRSLTNNQLVIEEKGVNAYMVDNHCSYIITNNLDKVNHVTYDDRRYSVPVLGKKKIKEIFGQDWLDSIYEKIEIDVEFLGAIGHYILDKGQDLPFSDKHPYITESFYDIVEKALKIWQRKLIEIIESKQYDRIDLTDIAEDLRGTGHTKVAGFLEHYRDRDGNPYGYVTRSHRGDRYIVVGEKYSSKITETVTTNNTEEKFDFN